MQWNTQTVNYLENGVQFVNYLAPVSGSPPWCHFTPPGESGRNKKSITHDLVYLTFSCFKKMFDLEDRNWDVGVISEFKLSQTFDDILGAVEEIIDGLCVCVCVWPKTMPYKSS